MVPPNGQINIDQNIHVEPITPMSVDEEPDNETIVVSF